MGGRKAILAVEGCSIRRDDAADLVSAPVTDDLSASLLKEISMAWVEAGTADVSILALPILVASIATRCDLTVVIAGRVQIPAASAELSRLGIFGSGGTAFIWVC